MIFTFQFIMIITNVYSNFKLLICPTTCVVCVFGIFLRMRTDCSSERRVQFSALITVVSVRWNFQFESKYYYSWKSRELACLHDALRLFLWSYLQICLTLWNIAGNWLKSNIKYIQIVINYQNHHDFLDYYFERVVVWWVLDKYSI